jgi:hypothetical protein
MTSSNMTKYEGTVSENPVFMVDFMQMSAAQFTTWKWPEKFGYSWQLNSGHAGLCGPEAKHFI